MKHFSVYLLATLLLAFTLPALAQDDELPPPSSKPRDTEEVKTDDRKPPNPNEFEGFKKKKKIDFSKFIIEPNFNLSIGQGSITAGLSPYVGYKVWEPKSPKAKGVNNGLFAGGGITYMYFGVTNYPITDPTGIVVARTTLGIHTYGGGAFLQYNIWRGLFARVRTEFLNRRIPVSYDLYTNNTFKVNYQDKFYPAVLIGAGYNLLQSKNFFMPIMVSYNLLHSVTDKTYSLYPRGVVIQLGFINLF